jgi:branched-chain amino acid transport system substrate-binding protein
MNLLRQTLSTVACAATPGAPALAPAQAIKIAGLYELPGAGASACTNVKNGVDPGVKEINAAGGILGRKLAHTIADTQSNAGVAKGLARKAIDDNAFAVFGPVLSGVIMGSMAETHRAEVPNFAGGQAAAITKQGNPYVFRTRSTQDTATPKAARSIANGLKAKGAAVLYVNNDFGKGGRDAITRALGDLGVKVVADISTDSGQVDFSAPVLKAKQSNADALFVDTNEEDSARALRELRKQGYNKPIVGETTPTGQKVIELAGDEANGATAHVGLTVDAPDPLML